MRSLAYAVSALIAVMAMGIPATAGVVSPDGVVSLTPEEREAALESAAADPINGAAGSRAVHGEMGIEMDSRGGHAVYGTAAMPIGSSGFLALSFLNGQYGRPFRR